MPRAIEYARPKGREPKAMARLYDEARGEDHRFYCSTAWIKTRAVKLASSPLCEPCLARGIVKEADTVHHRSERKAAPELALTLANLESVCRACHGAKRKEPRFLP